VRSKHILFFICKKTTKNDTTRQIIQSTKHVNSPGSERLEAIGELSARIAHDLRNPLAVIQCGVEAIKQDVKCDEKTIARLERMQRAVGRMTHQINEVLDFTKPRSLVLSQCHILDIIKEVISNSSNVEIKSLSENIKIICDKEKLKVVFNNMITNANHAITDGDIISIQTSEDKNNIIIQISDSGHGISADILPKIFEPLFTTKQKGTGLGLTSCKSIIQEHGGTINVSSEIGKGTTFTIILPKDITRLGSRVNEPGTILEKISKMKNHDHLAFEFSDNDELSEYISEFMMLGMRKNCLNVLVISKEEIDDYYNMLTSNGISIKDLVNSEDLIICSHDEMYQNVKVGSSFEPVIKYLNKVHKIAKKKKKTGLCIIGIIAGNLENNGNHKDCIRIEKAWHEIIPNYEMPIRLICPYKSLSDSKTIESLVLYHNDGLIRHPHCD
jgi:hypothetical protein